ncbi:MAG: hypothetical protein JSR77_14245 [Planctomycetes bacterium]|nr:hypothetical protein [Planctomycetota bacterium]
MRKYLIGAAAAILAAGGASAITVRGGTGANAAGLQAFVDQFRGDLGALNANVAGTQNGGAGRREINWDGVPDGFSSPNALPANFFNANSPRGAVFSGASSFAVSSRDTTATPVRFGDIDASYTSTFQTFSPQRLFTSLGSNTYDVEFFVPGSNTPALVRGFGAVFADVDLENRTTIECFNESGVSLGTFAASALDGGLSFVGVFDGVASIHRVRVTFGKAALGSGVIDGGGTDLVVADDFLYGEPVQVPGPGAALLLGLAAFRRRSRVNPSRG